MNKLKKLCEFGNLSLIGKLEEATWAVNILFSRAIGTSPDVLKVGRQPILKVDIENGIEIKQENLTWLKERRDLNWKDMHKGTIERERKR